MQDSALQLRGASTWMRWPSIWKVMPVPPACADVVAISSAAIATSFFILVSMALSGGAAIGPDATRRRLPFR
ncbi:hypothetical protein ACVIGA_002081 [Bradyrhizobium sp. USDA 3240]